MKLLKALIDLNFKFSVFFSIFGGIIVFRNPENYFSSDFRLYGPLGNNLLIVAVLVAVMQGLLWFRYLRGGYKEALAMGCLFILIGYDLEVYADANDIYIDPHLARYGFYCGAAHVLYFLSGPEKRDS